MNRRKFIKSSLGASMPLLIPLPLKELMTPTGDVQQLVFIQLAGGNDGYNTLIPYTNREYYSQRPSLAIPKNEVIHLNQTHGLHPALGSLSVYYHNRELCFINYAGTAEAEHSHHAAAQAWKSAFSISMQEPTDISLRDQLKTITQQMTSSDERVFSAVLDGFDTHQFQSHKHGLLLNEYASELHSFIEDLKTLDKFDETMIITWSEFGRSFRQNIRKGTDHGNENMMIVAGGSLKISGIINAEASVLLSPAETYDLVTAGNHIKKGMA